MTACVYVWSEDLRYGLSSAKWLKVIKCLGLAVRQVRRIAASYLKRLGRAVNIAEKWGKVGQHQNPSAI